MQKDWWLALPNGQRFNMTGEEIARKIESGEFEPNLLGSYQGGPYVPLIQSPAFRQAYDRRQARLIEKQKAESRKFFKVMAVMSGVAFAGIVLFGIAATVINNVTESNRVEREQREAAKIKEEERQIAERKQKAFDEMPPAKKIEKAKALAATEIKESIEEAYRYLDSIPEGDSLKKEAIQEKERIAAIEKKKEAERNAPPKPPTAAEIASLRELLASRYCALIQAENSHLNYIGTKITASKGGYAIWATHEFFTQYAFSTGDEGPSTQRFIQNNYEALKKAKVVRVGLMGSGPYSSYCYFNVD